MRLLPLALAGLLLRTLTMAGEPPAAAGEFPPGPITARDGVLRRQDGREAALWGVNYEFNLSWEYHTYFQPLGVPLTFDALRAIADRDFDDLAAMRVDVVRAHLLPADFTDAKGDLVDTVFLRALDYLVARARQKGMYVFLSLFNRMGSDFKKDSFAAARFGANGERNRAKSPYLFDPVLVDAYERYVRQLMQRRNSFTGIRYADEPAIAAWELMNEPEYPELKELGEPGFARIRTDWESWRGARAGSDPASRFRQYRGERVRGFIDRFCGAIRETGARQPIFWSFNWPGFIADYPEIAAAARASRADGVSFCLYPGQDDLPRPIDFRHLPSLAGKNYLPMLRPDGVDWSELRRTRESGKAVVAYEFETWCNDSAYLYPALARLFRELGAQIACMWEYDPAIAAEYNIVASHFLNRRTSPAKAASFLVAGEAFRRLPRAAPWPDERLGDTEFRFGPFGASFAENTSWYIGDDTLLYARGLPAPVADPALAGRPWRVIAGTGSSPAIDVAGDGLYRLEKIPEGFRLTLLPTAEVFGDLWQNVWDAPPAKKIRLHDEPRAVRLKLAGWTGRLMVRRADADAPLIVAEAGQFSVAPGLYIVTTESGR